MKKLVINFVYDCNNKDDMILDTLSYYAPLKSDRIIITKKSITIIAERGNKNRLDSVLTNTNSTLYAQLLKSITYVYLTEGKAFKIGNVSVDINGEIQTYSSKDIVNPCTKDLDIRFLLDRKQCKKIFDLLDSNENLLIAYICFIKGVDKQDFDLLWKSFNSIYSIISSSDKEFDKLRDTKTFIETNWSLMLRTNAYMDGENDKTLRQLRIREFVLNNFEDISKTKAYSEMIKSFRDCRMALLFKEIMPYRKDNLVNEGLFSSVDTHIEKQIAKGDKINCDLARFYVLKYSYFLRNKYFHAEKSSPIFILKKNNEIVELTKICEIMCLFLTDLFDCYVRYCK